MYIYVASSWRNDLQPEVVRRLREAHMGVYDFKDPMEGKGGFHWSDVDPNWESWTPAQYVKGLDHRYAVNGFAADMEALNKADMVVLVMPCGRSAHLELGYACGQGKRTAILLDDGKPELMNKMVNFITGDLSKLVRYARCYNKVPLEA